MATFAGLAGRNRRGAECRRRHCLRENNDRNLLLPTASPISIPQGLYLLAGGFISSRRPFLFLILFDSFWTIRLADGNRHTMLLKLAGEF